MYSWPEQGGDTPRGRCVWVSLSHTVDVRCVVTYMWVKYVCVEASVQSGTGAGSKCHYQLTGVRLHGAQILWRGPRWAVGGSCVYVCIIYTVSGQRVCACVSGGVCVVCVCVSGCVYTLDSSASWFIRIHLVLITFKGFQGLKLAASLDYFTLLRSY